MGDVLGDYCDGDIDGDTFLNSDDECPFMYGNSYCFEELNREHPGPSQDIYTQPVWKRDELKNHTNELEGDGCQQKSDNSEFIYALMFILILFAGGRKK